MELNCFVCKLRDLHIAIDCHIHCYSEEIVGDYWNKEGVT